MYKIEQLDQNKNSDLVNLWERSVRATHDFLSEEDLLFYKSRLPLYLENLSIYGAIEDNTIKGFIGISDDNIEMLFVDSLYFNLGIGSQLLKYAIKDINIKMVDVNEQNLQALNFTKSMVF